VQIGDEMAARALTQFEQQKEVSKWLDSGNGSVNSAAGFGGLLIPKLLAAGIKSRLHTKHLGGKTASSKMLKSAPTQREASDLAK
jgi:hypothetical protein